VLETCAAPHAGTIELRRPELAAQTVTNRWVDISSRLKMRSILRETAVLALSLPRRVDRTSGWIRFLLYHGVLDRERKDLIRQLDYLRNFGDFISLDEAVSLLERQDSFDGRHFCITFDDAFKNQVTNALPILVEKGIPAAFFLPVRLIGLSTEKFVYFTWDDCRNMASAGMVIGSHTSTHARLVELGPQQVADEMRESKRTIEEELGLPACLHFSCPYGTPGVDFVVDRDPSIARQVGYRSFLTSQRGQMRCGDSPYLIRRDEVIPSWGNYRLRYYFSR
jgi:peptidoglycan/xylan/chitin deacetylase (PgdA/CDA1 family)